MQPFCANVPLNTKQTNITGFQEHYLENGSVVGIKLTIEH